MKAPIARCLLATIAILSLPAIAGAAPDRWEGWKPYESRYLTTYEKCWDAFKDDCGRNLLDYAWKGGEAPSEARVKKSAATMIRWLNPPVVEEPAASSSSMEYVAPAPTASVPATSAGGCPSYMAAEADSPSDVNPTSGAAGCFQILPSTQAAHGCADVGPECAAIICATEGPGAWAASGANPCPYVQP